MKRIVLIPLLLSTFLLVGCESELDRCIEGNSPSFDYWGARVLYRMIRTEEDPSKRRQIERSASKEEARVFGCVYSEREDYLYEIVRVPADSFNFVTTPKFTGSVPPIDIEMKVFDDHAENCIQKEKESAKKICHRQGIY